jgi:hypothetical protein
VKADLLHHGDLQVAGLAQGSTAVMPQTAAGNYLAKLNETVAANDAQGVVYREQHHLDSIVLGRLPDPNAPTSITWAVEERGRARRLTSASGAARRYRGIPGLDASESRSERVPVATPYG